MPQDNLKIATEYNWEQAIGALPTPYLIISDKLKIIAVNKATLNLFQLTNEEIRTRSYLDIYSIFSAPPSANAILECQQSKQTESQLIFLASQNVWLQLEASPIFNESNEITSFVIIIYDTQKAQLTNKSIHDSEENFFSAFKNSPISMSMATVDGNYLEINEAFANSLGYPIEELTDNTVTSITHPDDVTMERTLIKELVEGKRSSYLLNKRYMHQSGKIIWGRIYRTIVMKDQSPQYLLGVWIDINEQKQTQETLEKSETRYRILAESAQVAFYETDENGNCIYVNKKWLEFTGFTFEQAMGIGWRKAIHEDDRENIFSKWEDNTKARISWNQEFRFKSVAGKTTWVIGTATPIFDKNSQLMGYIGTNLDITKRKLYEIELKKSEEKFKSVVDNLPNIVLTTDLDLNIDFINNYDHIPIEENNLGKNLRDLIPKDELAIAEEIFKNVATKREPSIHETLSNDKSEWMEIKFAPKLEHDELIGYILVITNITDRKKYEHELQSSKEKAEESDRLKSAFLANMSHEIRTPMNGILGFSELLKEPEISLAEQKEYLGVIQESGRRMINLIDNLIDVSKIEAGQMSVHKTTFRLKETIKYLISFFKKEAGNKNLSLIYHAQLLDSDLEIHSDKEKLYAILFNLLNNAIKYTFEGHIEIGYSVHRSEIEFYVKDTGIGIEEDKHELIFKRFAQADLSISRPFEGAGLGLSIAEAYVRMLEGKIWLESKAQQGSTFYFSIPISPEYDNRTESEPKSEIDKYLNDLTILIVEDDPTSRNLLSFMLKNKCKKLLTANDGYEAIRVCKSNKVNLILMDIKLPLIDGLETTRKIREFDKDLIIVAQTAFAMKNDKDQALSAGCNYYITKPILKNKLIELLKTIYKSN